MGLFDLFQRPSKWVACAVAHRAGMNDVRGQILGQDEPVFAEHRRSLDGILEFANVAGPVVGLKVVQTRRMQA